MLINVLMKAKTYGIDIASIVCCPLPYGTGNDFCKILKWGNDPSEKFFKKIGTLIKEIC